MGYMFEHAIHTPEVVVGDEEDARPRGALDDRDALKVVRLVLVGLELEQHLHARHAHAMHMGMRTCVCMHGAHGWSGGLSSSSTVGATLPLELSSSASVRWHTRTCIFMPERPPT